MGRKSIFTAILIIVLAVFINGCNSSPTTAQENNSKSSYDYVKTLDNGVKINLTKKSLDKDLMGIEFSFDCDSGSVSLDEAALQTDSFNCCLINKTDGTKIMSSGDAPFLNNTLYFDNVDLKNYNLHFECPVTIELNSPYSVDVNINEGETETHNKISLPLDNYIEVNKTSVHTGYDKYSDKCVEIYFSTSENVMFDIKVDKSEISTGAPVGDLKEISNNTYVYTHPITDTEKTIALSFTSLKISDNINCDIEL